MTTYSYGYHIYGYSCWLLRLEAAMMGLHDYHDATVTCPRPCCPAPIRAHTCPAYDGYHLPSHHSYAATATSISITTYYCCHSYCYHELSYDSACCFNLVLVPPSTTMMSWHTHPQHAILNWYCAPKTILILHPSLLLSAAISVKLDFRFCVLAP